MKVLAFGVTKDLIGSSSIEISSLETPRVVDLKKHLNKQYPKFEELNSLAIAVNEEYAEDSLELKDSDVVALIPPVSGG